MEFSYLKNLLWVFALVFAPLWVMGAEQTTPAAIYYRGINLPQAAFASQNIPGIPNKDYKWPTAHDIDLYADMGFNLIRVAFLWERMQPKLYSPLTKAELASLDAVIDHAEDRKLTVLLDVHNFGHYRGIPIGAEEVNAEALANLWKRLAERYKKRPHVAFGIMNEPFKQAPLAWAIAQQKSIDAIRAAGANQLILLSGTSYSGAHSWLKSRGDASNADVFSVVNDPANNYMIEVHQYFDSNSSGTHLECVSEDVGKERLLEFTKWLRKTGQRGFLGEFGASKDPVCVEALRRTLGFMAENSDVWGGWAYWAAAAWFGNYMFNIYPPDADKYPQVPVLKQALQRSQ